MSSYGFWRFAEENPASVAVIDAAGVSITAGALLAAANQLVHGLLARGVARGDVVASVLPASVELLELYLAAMQAGLHFAPLNPALTSSELAAILEDARPAAVFSDLASVAAMKSGQPSSSPPDRSAGERLYYTSGTTGRPRAIRRALTSSSPEEAARASILHLRTAAGIRPRSGAIHLVSSPLHHSASLLWCTDHLQLGHTVVLLEKWTPAGMLAAMTRHRVTATFVVPTQFHRLLALPPAEREAFDPSSLKHVVHGGAPCLPDLKYRMISWWGPVIYEVYGAAEAGGTHVSSAEWLERPGTVGRGNVRVLREDGSDAAPREIGSVVFVIGDRLIDAGDLGYLDEEKYLYLCARKSDVIISGGVNIYPAEVEAALFAHPSVADAVVFGVPDEEWGERVQAMIVARGPLSSEEVIAFCREKLAPHKLPRSVVFAGVLPRDESGKISRKKLREGMIP